MTDDDGGRVVEVESQRRALDRTTDGIVGCEALRKKKRDRSPYGAFSHAAGVHSASMPLDDDESRSTHLDGEA